MPEGQSISLGPRRDDTTNDHPGTNGVSPSESTARREFTCTPQHCYQSAEFILRRTKSYAKLHGTRGYIRGGLSRLVQHPRQIQLDEAILNLLRTSEGTDQDNQLIETNAIKSVLTAVFEVALYHNSVLGLNAKPLCGLLRKYCFVGPSLSLKPNIWPTNTKIGDPIPFNSVEAGQTYYKKLFASMALVYSTELPPFWRTEIYQLHYSIKDLLSHAVFNYLLGFTTPENDELWYDNINQTRVLCESVFTMEHIRAFLIQELLRLFPRARGLQSQSGCNHSQYLTSAQVLLAECLGRGLYKSLLVGKLHDTKQRENYNDRGPGRPYGWSARLRRISESLSQCTVNRREGKLMRSTGEYYSVYTQAKATQHFAMAVGLRFPLADETSLDLDERMQFVFDSIHHFIAAAAWLHIDDPLREKALISAIVGMSEYAKSQPSGTPWSCLIIVEILIFICLLKQIREHLKVTTGRKHSSDNGVVARLYTEARQQLKRYHIPGRPNWDFWDTGPANSDTRFLNWENNFTDDDGDYKYIPLRQLTFLKSYLMKLRRRLKNRERRKLVLMDTIMRAVPRNLTRRWKGLVGVEWEVESWEKIADWAEHLCMQHREWEDPEFGDFNAILSEPCYF